MESIIADMLRLQDQLNIMAIGPDWRSQDKDWPLAAMIECAEGIEHLGWKWWKKQEPNIPAAQVEAIDILHFSLSWYMAHRHQAPLNDLAQEIASTYAGRYATFWADGTNYEPKSMEPKDLFRLIAMGGSQHWLDIELVFVLCEKLGMTFDEVNKLYRAKCTLNLFRQHHGYKEGTYRKEWAAGLEDNDVMQAMMGSIDWTAGDASAQLCGKLDVYYRDLIA